MEQGKAMNLASAFHAVPRGIPLPASLPFPPPGGYPPEGIVAADWIIRRATELGLTVKKTGRQRLRISGGERWYDPGVAQLAAEIRRMNFAWIVHAAGPNWEGTFELDFRDAGVFYPEPSAANRAAKEAQDAAYRARESAMLRALADAEDRAMAALLEKNRKDAAQDTARRRR